MLWTPPNLDLLLSSSSSYHLLCQAVHFHSCRHSRVSHHDVLGGDLLLKEQVVQSVVSVRQAMASSQRRNLKGCPQWTWYSQKWNLQLQPVPELFSYCLEPSCRLPPPPPPPSPPPLLNVPAAWLQFLHCHPCVVHIEEKHVEIKVGKIC